MVRLRSTPFVVTLSSTYSELSLQFSSGLHADSRRVSDAAAVQREGQCSHLQSRLMGSQPGAPGMGPYGPSMHCSCIRTRKSQAFFGEQLPITTLVQPSNASGAPDARYARPFNIAAGVTCATRISKLASLVGDMRL